MRTWISSTKRGTLDCDTLIIGGGTAGAVLAHRLSEDAARRVVVVEAGPDVVPGREPADIRAVFPLSVFNPAHAWPGLRVHWRAASNAPAVPMIQGRMVGGTSNVMGMWAMRGKPEVYDQWAAMGAAGWDWLGVLPYFRRLEHDMDFGGDLHGNAGPLPIRRQPVAEWPPLALAFRQAARSEGYGDVADMNGDARDGLCVLPVSRQADARASAGLCYLDAATRARPNLTVLADTSAQTLLFAADAGDAPRVVGAALTLNDGSRREIRAREVVLAAGALKTPELLMSSGIGPPDVLAAAGVRVRRALRGVGRNLQNHPMLFLVSFLERRHTARFAMRPAGVNYLRWSSGLEGYPAGDMGMSVRDWLSWHALGRRMGAVAPTVAMPASRGRVELVAGATAPAARVEFRLLDDARDLTRMMAGVRLAARLYRNMRSVAGEAHVLAGVANIGRLIRYNEPTAINAWRARAAALLLDVAPGLGRRRIAAAGSMLPIGAILGSDEAIARFALDSVSGAGHLCGTCRIGAAGDRDAVVDAAGRVHGVAGLRVADASVMPVIPSGGTHVPTIMVAEKMADHLRGDA